MSLFIQGHSNLLFFLCGKSILITKAQTACSRGANPLAKPMIICRMKCSIIQSEKWEREPVFQWLGHSGGYDSGGLIFVSRIACLDLWKKYIGDHDSGELEPRMGFYFICFIISFPHKYLIIPCKITLSKGH